MWKWNQEQLFGSITELFGLVSLSGQIVLSFIRTDHLLIRNSEQIPGVKNTLV
jgi:hypothetical protein